MTRRLLLIAVLCLCSSKIAHGDLYQYMVRTTEWLVDHSSVICVAEFADADSDSNPQVLSEIKGDSKTVTWPLKRPDFDGYQYFGPPANGMVRLLYIGEHGELWQAVKLRRNPIDSPTLYEVFYGANQFGDVHLTESSLLKCISEHMAKKPSAAVRRFRFPHFSRSGIEAPAYFPFENGGETFVLVVDFNVARRDHYLAQLENGDCAERLHAIRELSQLDDSRSNAAIEAATTASGVRPSHAFQWTDRRGHSGADEIVQSAAKDALKGVEKRRTQSLRGRPPSVAR